MAFCLFLESASAGQGLPNTHSLLSRTRRQTTEDNYCLGVLVRAQCSTGYLQSYINALSKCGEGEVSTINGIELSCRKNQQGLFCSEALVYVDGNCTGSTCTAGCSNSLRIAGCCINDGTSSQSSRYLATCSIELPSPCTRSHLQIPNTVQNRSCTPTDYGLAFCNNIMLVLNTITREEACKENTEWLQDLCSSKNGQYCFEEFINSSSSIGHQAIIKSGNDCSSLSNCSLQCSTSLNLVKNTVGCCFPYLNTTGSSFTQSSVYSAQLWNTCGIPVPQRCGSFSIVYNSSFASLLCLIIASFAMVFAQRM